MKKIITLFLVILFASSLFAGEYPDISINELQKAIKNGKVAVIDVNGARSYKKGHIPTAIDFSSSGKSLAKSLPKDKNATIKTEKTYITMMSRPPVLSLPAICRSRAQRDRIRVII